MFRRQNVMLAILLFTGQLFVFCQSATNKVCSENSSGMQVSLTSQKSPSGIWITQVGLERGGGDASRNNSWSLDVESKTKTCQRSGSSLYVTLTIKSPLTKHRPDYDLLPGLGFYKLHEVPTTWPLARKICEDEDAHLMIINSAREIGEAMTFFSTRLRAVTGSTSNDFMWIGVDKKDGDYWTVLGDAFNSTGFTNWDAGEPSGGIKEDCLFIKLAMKVIHNWVCDKKMAFICEHVF